MLIYKFKTFINNIILIKKYLYIYTKIEVISTSIGGNCLG